MPIQVIITGNDPAEVRHYMAGFLAATPEQIAALPPAAEPIGNGVDGNQEANAAPQKRTRGRPKSTPAEEQRQDAAGAEAEVQQEAADETQVEDIEAARDRVRTTINTEYVDKYGMDFTIPDILWMYGERFPGGSVTKVSDIPAGMHDRVIQDIIEMSKVNHFKRKRIDL